MKLLTEQEIAIKEVGGDFRHSVHQEIYIAGYRAGLEAAAGECDRYAQTFGAPGPWLGGAASCAQAIRSMLNEPIDSGGKSAR